MSEAAAIDWLAWKHEQELDAVGGGGIVNLPLAPRVPAAAEDSFRCEHFRCTMAGRVCVERQGATFLIRNEGHKRARPDLRMGFCVSGACAQGKEIVQALGKLPERRPLAWAPKRRGAASSPTAAAATSIAPVPLERTRPTPPPLTSEERAELAAELKSTTTPAPPAEEISMTKNEAKERLCSKGCGRKLRSNNTTGHCSANCDKAASAAAPAGESKVVRMIREQLAHARAKAVELKKWESEAERLQRALDALTEAA